MEAVGVVGGAVGHALEANFLSTAVSGGSRPCGGGGRVWARIGGRKELSIYGSEWRQYGPCGWGCRRWVGGEGWCLEDLAYVKCTYTPVLAPYIRVI